MNVKHVQNNNNKLVGNYGNILNTYSNDALPETVEEVFRWGELLWLQCGDYTQAVNKTIRYFLTEINISGDINYKVREKYKSYFMKDLKILDKAYLVGRDLFMYGNAMLSHYDPFTRTLVCSKCSSSFPIENIEYAFSQHSGFEGKCLACKRNVKFKRVDSKNNTEKLSYIRWSPRDIHIEYNELTEDCEYYLSPSDASIDAIREGRRVYLNNTPWEFVEAALNNKKLRFDKGQLLHLAYEGIASLKNQLNGWGLPPFMACFDQVIHLNMLKRFNEAILLEHLIPFRFISPPKGGPENDPLLDIDTGQFMEAVQQMIAEQKKNPTAIHTVPYPVNYQEIGGGAKNLAPVEMIQGAVDSLLNTMGIPMEFRDPNLKVDGPMLGLKVFEREQASFFSLLDVYLDWVKDKTAQKLLWENVEATWKPVSIQEDQLSRQIKMDMLGANKISNTTALSSFNIDYAYEIDKVIEEQTMFDEKMVERDRKAQAAGELQAAMDQPLQDPNAQGGPPMQGGPMPQGGPGGAPTQGAGGTASMDEIHMQAEQQAQELLTTESSQRRSILIQLKKSDETLHALVKEKLKTLEQQAAQQGLNMTRAGQAPPPGM